MHIRSERPDDLVDIRHVNDSAFCQRDESRIVEALRDGGHARLSLVAEIDGRVVGHILFSASAIETESGVVDALALAPMAVLPGFQRRGVGSALVREGLRLSCERGARIVLVLGHADYYPRFGFSPELARALECEYAGPHFMALELVEGALRDVRGTVRYPPPLRGE